MIMPKLKQPTITRNREISSTASTNDPWKSTVDFIISHEGSRMQNGYHIRYQNKGDVPTIGYGTTNPKWVNLGRLTEVQARQAMIEDLIRIQDSLRDNVPNFDTLPQGAKDVLYDIAYNIGEGGLYKKSPKFMGRLREGDYSNAAAYMNWGNRQEGFANGLRKRNTDRQNLWNSAFKNLNAPMQPEQNIYNAAQYRPQVTIKMPTMQYHEQPVSQGTGALLQRNTGLNPYDKKTFLKRILDRGAARMNYLDDLNRSLNQ